jgi:hypothetical protein
MSFARRRDGRLLGRPGHHADGRYLLSGFASCSACDGSIRIVNRQLGHVPGNRAGYYCCSKHETRGNCDNNMVVRHELFDRAVLGTISALLDPSIVSAAVDRALAMIQGQQGQGRRAELQREAQGLVGKERKLIAAITMGEPPTALVEALKELEGRRAVVDLALAEEESRAEVPLDSAKIRRELLGLAHDVKELLAQHPAQARQALKKLLVGPIVCTPVREPGRRGYRFRGTLTVGKLIQGEVLTRLGVTTRADSTRQTSPVEWTRRASTMRRRREAWRAG